MNWLSVPSKNICDEIRRMLSANRICMIQGQPGSGKSTTIPWYVNTLQEEFLQRPCSSVCSAPRRLMVTGIVAYLCRHVEGTHRYAPQAGDIGYGIGNEATMWGRKVNYVTHGYFKRRFSKPEDFFQLSTILIDEVHEQSPDAECVSVLSNLALKKNTDLKLVLMSATIEHSAMAIFFAAGSKPISLGSSLFPVEVYYLEDLYKSKPFRLLWPAIGKLLDHQNREGPPTLPFYVLRLVANLAMLVTQRGRATLIFLPGLEEIHGVAKCFHYKIKEQQGADRNAQRSDWCVSLLHSSVPVNELRGLDGGKEHFGGVIFVSLCGSDRSFIHV